MQKLWKVVLEPQGCTEVERLVLEWRFKHGTKVGTLDAVRHRLAEAGITNGPLSRERIRQIAREALCKRCRMLFPGSDEQKVARAVARLLKMKRSYSCATEDDPYLQGRLEWRRLHWVQEPGVEYLSAWEQTVDYLLNQ